MTKRLAKKTIVVTGAASGIGKAVCDLALNEGAFVVGVDSDFKNEPTKFKKIEGDVRSKLTVEKVKESIEELHGLALIAGISRSHIPIDQGTSQDWDDIFDVNVKSNWEWLTLLLPNLRRATSSSIVMTASQLAFSGGINNAPYIASKGAVISLAKTAALELAEDNIRVNVIAPGAIDTPLLKKSLNRSNAPKEVELKSKSRHAMKRFGTVVEVANGFIYLLSEESSFTTGTVLRIDGGWVVA
jgi:NAD(P)-dependent dehydrogenase (short-subunit alcohol dehydrogenase family)